MQTVPESLPTPGAVKNLLLGKRDHLQTKENKIFTKFEDPDQKEQDRIAKKKMFIILSNCPLKLGYVGKEAVLLNSNLHKTYIQKKSEKPLALFRPDIVQQVLIAFFCFLLAKIIIFS